MEGDLVNGIAPALQEIMEGLEPGLRIAAQWMLGLLFGFQLAWGTFENLLRYAKFGEFASFIIKEVLVVSVFTGFIWGGSELASWLIGFMEAAGAGDAGPMTPSAIIGTGLEMTNSIVKSAGLWDAVFLYGMALIMLLAFILIAGLVIIKVCEAAFVISGGLFFLGFAGSRWTRDQAVAVIKYVFSVGAALFTLRLLVGLGSSLGNGWVEVFNGDNANLTYADAGVALSGAIILLMLVWRLTETVQSFVSGSSMHGTQSFMAAAAFAGAGASLAASKLFNAAGVAGLLKNSYQLASATREAAGKPTSGLAGIAGNTTSALGAAAKGLLKTTHDRAAGRISPRASMLWQTSATLGDTARQQVADHQWPVNRRP